MGKNPLDINRKLKKYQQQVKVLRKGIQVRVNDLSTNKPDFALGPYQVKGSTQYSLIINPELPKKNADLIVDFWGLRGTHLHLERINSGRIHHSNKESRIKFYTYPKTKFIFMTFKLEFEDDPSPATYNINYIYLDSKHPLPRATITASIPNSFQLEYNLECHPHTLAELDLDNPLKEFNLPINMNIFEHSLLTYLLQKETGPSYFDALTKNISLSPKFSGSGLVRGISEIKVNVDILKKLQGEIIDGSKKMEKYLTKIDNLINHKHSLENHLDQPDTEKHDNQANKTLIYQHFIDGLNLKLNHIKKLVELNSTINLGENEVEQVKEILDYYEKRVLADQVIVKSELNRIETSVDEYVPNNKNEQEQEQERLDMILTHYRELKKRSSILKKDIDLKIVKFINLWYQFILSKNESAVEY